jgi:hypothetical protein
MTRQVARLALVALVLTAPSVGAQVPVEIKTYPARPLIERGADGQYLNFDFGLENESDQVRQVERLELAVFDSLGRLAWRQFIWTKGAADPGFLTVPDRTIPAKGSLALFNPFYRLPVDLVLGRLDYRFIFGTKGIESTEEVTVSVSPVGFQPKTRLVLPVDGPAIVYDGHDYYSHHRRIPLGGPVAKRLKLEGNPVRYANDLSPVGPSGELARGPLSDPTSWYAYGATVRAPADGEVVSAFNDVPDNRIENGDLVVPPEVARDEARASLGNHLIIKHTDGEFSLLAHLQMGSVRFKPGDRVKGGEPVGRIGFSGDTGFHVHLHHMLSTAAAMMAAEGLPSYFDRIRRVSLPKSPGGAVGPVLNGARIDTGDLIESVR